MERGEKISVLYVNTHQTASATELALSNQVDRMSQPDDVSQPLESVAPVLAHEHMYKVARGPEIEAIWEGLQNYCSIFNLPATETNIESLTWQHPSRRPISYFVVSSTLERAMMNFDWNILCMGLPFLTAGPETASLFKGLHSIGSRKTLHQP